MLPQQHLINRPRRSLNRLQRSRSRLLHLRLLLSLNLLLPIRTLGIRRSRRRKRRLSYRRTESARRRRIDELAWQRALRCLQTWERHLPVGARAEAGKRIGERYQTAPRKRIIRITASIAAVAREMLLEVASRLGRANTDRGRAVNTCRFWMRFDA
jgi:hypothetical protein